MPYHKDKKNKRSDKYVDLPNLNIYYTWKKKKKLINLKLQLLRGMINLNCLMNHILYRTFKMTFILFDKSSKSMKH